MFQATLCPLDGLEDSCAWFVSYWVRCFLLGPSTRDQTQNTALEPGHHPPRVLDHPLLSGFPSHSPSDPVLDLPLFYLLRLLSSLPPRVEHQLRWRWRWRIPFSFPSAPQWPPVEERRTRCSGRGAVHPGGRPAYPSWCAVEGLVCARYISFLFAALLLMCVLDPIS